MIMSTTPPLYQHNVRIVLKETNAQTKGGIILTPIYNTSSKHLTAKDFDVYDGTLPGTTCNGMISQSEVNSLTSDELSRTWYKIIAISQHEDNHFYITALPMYKETYKPNEKQEAQSGKAITISLYDSLYTLTDQVTQIL